MRTINEIYDEMAAEKQNLTTLQDLSPNQDSLQSLLSDLSSASTVAGWRLVLFTVAAGIYLLEVLFAAFRDETNQLVSAAAPGTPRWYRDTALAFQFGDVLEYLDYKYQYAQIDASKQIVQRVAIDNRGDGLVLVKAAKIVQGSPAPLATAELAAFESYMAKVKFAGTRLAVVSVPADQLIVGYAVGYDPQVPLSTLQATIQEVVESHLSELKFNGELNITRLTDAIQSVEGVVDPVYQSATATPNAQTAVAIGRSYVARAGYFELAQPISQSFTFTPVLT